MLRMRVNELGIKTTTIFRICFFIWASLASYSAQGQGHFNPIEFIQNKGQWDGPFEYKASVAGSDFFLSKNHITYHIGAADNGEKIHDYKHGKLAPGSVLNFHAYKVYFLDANPNPTILAAKPQAHYYNYYLGADPARWQSEIHPNLSVDYKDLYPGIDLHFYSENSNLKYDVIVEAGADVSKVKFAYEGLDGISVSNKGSLSLKTSVGENLELKPYAYQYNEEGKKITVSCEYQLKGNVVSFKMGKSYNPKAKLVIDPVVVFCTFTGSTADNWGYTATYDTLGNFYAGGITGFGTGTSYSGTYPTSTGAIQVSFGGGGPGGMGNVYRHDATITKFNPQGTNFLYSTYLGGSDNDHPQSLVVNSQNHLVISGRTYSSNFPMSSTNSYDNTYNGGGDIFVSVFNANGTAFIGSSFIGGTAEDGCNYSADQNVITSLKHNYGDDARSEVIVDANDNIWITSSTKSSNFPTVNAFQPSFAGVQDAVIFKMNSTASALSFSSYIGGNNNDAGYVLAIDKANPVNLFVAGGTESNNFPTLGPVIATNYFGGIDGWILKLNANTYVKQKTTYIGTSSYDQIYGIQTDDSGYVYIMGQTMGAFPVVGTGVYNNPNSRQFASKLSNDLTNYIRSCRWGKGASTTTDLALNAFLVDVCGNIYISGWGGDLNVGNPGNTFNLPTTANALQSTTDGDDFYFIVFKKNFDTVLYASFFGQNGGGGEHVDGGTSRFDPQGRIYQSICARCGNSGTPPNIVFPTTPGVYGPANLSTNCNLAALKLDFQIIGANAEAVASPSSTGCAPFTVNFNNFSTNATGGYLWDFGDGSPTSNATTPTHTYTNVGTYTVTLVAYNPNGCLGVTDTDKVVINVVNNFITPNFNVVKIDSCNPFIISLTNTSSFTGGTFGPSTTWSWNFGDGSFSNVQSPPNHSYANAGTYTITLIITDTNACNSPIQVSKIVNFNTSFVDGNFNLQDTACPPFNAAFANTGTGTVVTYLWNFGDGNTSTAATPSHTYNTPGTYTVTLIVGNPNTCNLFDTTKRVLKILPKLTAAFTTLKVDTCDPYILQINNNSIGNNLDPLNTTYTWDFGDGTTFTGKNPPNHVYATPGTFTIKLTLTDPTACNSPQVFTQNVTFIDNNVRANLNLPPVVCIPFTYTFNNNIYNATTYSWNFGDGGTSNIATPTHVFATEGTFTVVVIVGNPLSCNKFDTATQVIQASGSPTANFNYLPFPLQANKPVNFNNLSVGATRYLWDFGDGTSSTDVNPKKLYNKSGPVTVCLTAFNEANCSDSTCQVLRPEVINIIDVPTGFSPNGDGNNDYVEVKGYGIETLDFRIFNRWGENVFRSNKLGARWDGTYKGVAQEGDAFSYFLNVTFTDGSSRILKGNITLIK